MLIKGDTRSLDYVAFLFQGQSTVSSQEGLHVSVGQGNGIRAPG